MNETWLSQQIFVVTCKVGAAIFRIASRACYNSFTKAVNDSFSHKIREEGRVHEKAAD
jgi:hypothetical protein